MIQNLFDNAASKISMKLLVDKNTQKVVFAEAGKDAVDFLFTILSLPVGTVTRLLTKAQMMGSIGNLYESVESLSIEYIQHNQTKDNLLTPKSPFGTPNFSLLNLVPVHYYKCYNSTCSRYVSDTTYSVTCPECGAQRMSKELIYVAPSRTKTTESQVGFVKEAVTYMVLDKLVIKPMSASAVITQLTNFNVKDIALLDEITVHLDAKMALKLLKESFHSEEVLTRVFLGTPKSG